MGTKTENIYSVGQVNSYIRNMFEQDFLLNSLRVRGEISNCKYHPSGHLYFTLKDPKGTLACVMFAGNRGGLQFTLKEGQQVVVQGNLTVYERDGKYQLYAKQITREGAGMLYEQFEQLKSKLDDMGMFAAEYKRGIPLYIRTLGVVTAPSGAAVRDIIQIAARRNPCVQIIIYPTVVQGELAQESIIKGIRALEAAGVDAMIVGRGGGSIEDLWAFNEEAVAQAIFNCRVPVISAVGHETDFTIADFVADLRAPTPSAAAELAVPEIGRLSERLNQYRFTMKRYLQGNLERCRSRAENEKMRLQYASPKSRIRDKRMNAMRMEERYQNEMHRILSDRRHELALYIEKMKALSPLQKLNLGYAYVTGSDQRMLNDVGKVKIGDNIQIQVKNGSLEAEVLSKKRIRRSMDIK